MAMQTCLADLVLLVNKNLLQQVVKMHYVNHLKSEAASAWHYMATLMLTTRSGSIVAQGYVIDLAAGLPAKMGISLEVEVKADDEQPVVNDSMDISIRGPVHSGEGIYEDQSTLLRVAYKQVKATIAGNFSEVATAQVCSAQTSSTSNNTQSGDLEAMIWHEYEQAITAAEVGRVIPVTTPNIYVIQPADLTDQATTIITSEDRISVQEWPDAQRADAAWAPWFDYF
eukprot:9557-Heterococcus_DN1.PRE.2